MQPVAIEKSYGSAELNETLVMGDKIAEISSEFPSPDSPDNLLLIKPLGLSLAVGDKLALRVSFSTLEGLEHTLRLETMLEVLTDDSSAGMRSLRKALTLVRFVDLQSEYCLQDEPSTDEPTEVRRQRHNDWVARIKDCRIHLVTEMLALGDTSLQGSNAATLQTIDQILMFEESELAALERQTASRPLAMEQRCNARGATASNTPHSHFCPITKSVMQDPVMAADGHSYERVAIERWFAEGSMLSPQTGLPLATTVLIPNHSLRQAIDEFNSPTRTATARKRGRVPSIPTIRKKPAKHTVPVQSAPNICKKPAKGQSRPSAGNW